MHEEVVEAEKPAEGAPTSCCYGKDLCKRIEDCPLELEFMEPMPENIDFMTIPKINEARSVWRAGMRKLEEVFAEHIANMHLDFDDRAN